MPEAARTLVSVTAFAIARGRQTCSAETGFLPVVRLGLKGTRRIVCVRAFDLMKYLKAQPTKGAMAAADSKAAYTWLKTVTQDHCVIRSPD